MAEKNRHDRFDFVRETMHEIDYSSYELGAVRLTLRRDLAIRRQMFGGDVCYVIEDPMTSRFYRIGVPEYLFLSLLDGKTSLADAVAETSSLDGEDAFTEMQAASLCSWLVQNSLASTAQSASVPRLLESAEQGDFKRQQQWLNPIMLKLPLFNPDRWVQKIVPLTGWLFSGFGLVLWCFVIAMGAYCLSMNWERLSVSSGGVLAQDNWLWLGVTTIALKLIHELAHAVSCRRFGGETRETGLLFLLFVPLPYVDVSSCWRFGSKWNRITVSAAGMIVEVMIAAVAMIVWSQTESLLVQQHAFNVMLTAGFVTLMFNVNPLMRFDGYYILSDFLELPNLATHGQQDLLSLMRKWVFGLKTEPPNWPEGRGWIIRLYGIAAGCWRITICVSLICGAEMLFHGAGIVLAAISVLLWIVWPTVKLVQYLVMGDPINPPNRLQFAAVMMVIAAVGAGIWNYVPVMDRVQLPAVVDYDPVTNVRVAASGFVKEIHVESGQLVSQGEPLVTLENGELQARADELRFAVEQSRLESTRHHRMGNVAAYQVEQENERALQKRFDEVAVQLEKLTVVAPISGRILSRGLPDYHGRWMSAGTELLTVGDDSEKGLQFVIPQADVNDIREKIGTDVTVHVWGTHGEDLNGQIASVEPRGTISLRFPALSAGAGGPLPVRPQTGQSGGSGSSAKEQWQLLEPHFMGQIAINKEDMANLGTGQRGIVELTTNRGTVGQVIARRWTEFLEQRQLRR